MSVHRSTITKITSYIRSLVLRRLAPDYLEVIQENADMKKDIYNLIHRTHEKEGQVSRLTWKIKFSLEEMLWFGFRKPGVNYDYRKKTEQV